MSPTILARLETNYKQVSYKMFSELFSTSEESSSLFMAGKFREKIKKYATDKIECFKSRQ